MISPPFLRKGANILILSTARKIATSELEPAVKMLQSWGLNVHFGKHLFGEDRQFSGTAAQRALDLQQAIDDPNIDAILCARGGYGTVQIIDRIDFSGFRERPKWIIGYSDVTVLHNHLQQLGFESLHATMPINFPKDEIANEATESLRRALFGEAMNYEVALPPNATQWFREGTANGELVGGNLSIVYSLTGTASSLDTSGKILFLEDLDEYLYHIDRMMMNLKRAGMLDQLAALLIGGMSDMNDNTIPYGQEAEEIIWEAVKEYNYPVAMGFPAGHLEDNRALIMGRNAQLRLKDDLLKLNFDGGA